MTSERLVDSACFYSSVASPSFEEDCCAPVRRRGKVEKRRNYPRRMAMD